MTFQVTVITITVHFYLALWNSMYCALCDEISNLYVNCNLSYLFIALKPHFPGNFSNKNDSRRPQFLLTSTLTRPCAVNPYPSIHISLCCWYFQLCTNFTSGLSLTLGASISSWFLSKCSNNPNILCFTLCARLSIME